jgi:hypothetical protein
MGKHERLKIIHDVAELLQRKLEGMSLDSPEIQELMFATKIGQCRASIHTRQLRRSP